MRALGDLVSGVAHELNNPLMASDTILHVIHESLQKTNPNKTRVELVQECNRRMGKIINHLREFSRQTQAKPEPPDIHVSIQNALMIIEQQLLNDNISTIKKLTPNLPRVLGDPNQLEQVFLNLISNARDAMAAQERRRELTIQTDLAGTKDQPEVRITFTDSGRGIPKDVIEKVYEPFFTTKDVKKGMGLGLSICYGIIENHGGRIEVESREREGTTLTIFLPGFQGGKHGKTNSRR
ncbi:MAG: GHKL domain-containing protein [Proteobacteria bacterium]|nr:GHKL domain-containing protein [Pseudomonadota bacterium]NIS70595.1 GHKL domain-containing protein [Pseudomonadota bacterium]